MYRHPLLSGEDVVGVCFLPQSGEGVLSILTFSILHAVNAFGAERLTPAR